MMDMKKAACEALDSVAEELNNVSQDIWNHPELALKEEHAHQVLTTFLETHGFSVERHHILSTAFRAVYEQGDGPHIAVMCEYDALPTIGHGCGHNLIAEVGAGAGIAIKKAMQAAQHPIGKITVLGTPAEEGFGGKIDLLRAGSFEEFDIALMAHPAPTVYSFWNAIFIGYDSVIAKFHGKPSHAAALPWDGVNALDAAVMAYNNISCLRQQIKPSWKIHGIITNGGVKRTIIPEESELDFCVGAPSTSELSILKRKLKACFEAAAMATGCKLELAWNLKPYSNVLNNPTLVKLYEMNATEVGIPKPAPVNPVYASTDMGNVSHVVPSIHPCFDIGTSAPVHSREFTQASGDPIAQPHVIQQAKTLAMTAIDVFCDTNGLKIIRDEFKQQVLLDEIED